MAVPSHTRAEAAAWLARLQSEMAGPDDRRACEAWLARSKINRRALAEVTAAWDVAGGLAAAPAPRRARAPARTVGRRELVAGALACGGVAAFWAAGAPRTYATEIGQVKRVRLDDGSTATLDTSSRIEVRFDRGARHVRLDRGRVRLDVAPDLARPFTVASRSLKLLALGRALQVSDRPDESAVVALDGPVMVKRPAEPAFQLASGLSLAGSGQVGRGSDRPRLDQETAWQDGRLVFDDEPLAAAAAEVNRYNRRHIVVAPELSDLRISGTYRAQDADAFAESAATLLGLTAMPDADTVRLEPARQHV